MPRALSSLSSALVLCAALGACSDQTATAPSQARDALADAANLNVSGGARVASVGRQERQSRTVERAVSSTLPEQPIYACPSVVQEDGTVIAMYVNCEPIIDEPVDPYVPPTTPTSPPVYANYSYGSDASAISNIVANGTILKTLTLSSFSQAISNVSSTSLSASFRNVGGQTSCSSVAQQFDSSYSSGSGSPLYLSSSRNPAWQGVIKWQVNGTHSFTPISGATGGGTFASSDFTCG